MKLNLFSNGNPERLQAHRRKAWETRWSQDGFNPKWAGRGVARELFDLQESGWLPAGGRVLDIGCGLGEIAAWFANQGYPALGIDLAQSAVEQAEAMHGSSNKLDFKAVDITDISAIVDQRFDILIDRGCFHTIPGPLIQAYVDSVSSLAADNAKLVIFTRAFRKQNRLSRWLMGEQIEQIWKARRIARLFADHFELQASTKANLGRPDDPASVAAMPGMMFQLVKI